MGLPNGVMLLKRLGRAVPGSASQPEYQLTESDLDRDEDRPVLCDGPSSFSSPSPFLRRELWSGAKRDHAFASDGHLATLAGQMLNVVGEAQSSERESIPREPRPQGREGRTP
jgi:hypothetical protein